MFTKDKLTFGGT